MNALFRRTAALGIALTLTASATALAAEDPANNIAVQLDGQNVVFTDAYPQVKEWRTFLPFRTVFEAMGAEVSYTEATATAPATVSGTRNGKTVTMTLGSDMALVTENGVTSTLYMDVAPYVDSDTWRTYVPVRFAAQALGANVGWDQDAQTVVIVDTEKLVEDALEGKSFTYLEKFLDYSQKYNEGIWDSTVTMNGNIQITMENLGSLNIPMTATSTGISEGSEKAQVSEKVTIDLSDLVDLLVRSEDMADMTADDKAIVDAIVTALAEKGITCEVRGDISTGKIYLNLDMSAFEEVSKLVGEELPDSDTWYLLDMNSLLAMSGEDMDFAQMMETYYDADYYKAMLTQALSEIDVNDAEAGYATVSTLLRTVVNALADDGFVKNGDTYTTMLQGATDGLSGKLALSLTMKDDVVTGYSLEITGDVDDDWETLSLDIKMAMDEKDQMTGSMKMIFVEDDDELVMTFDMSGAYTKGTTAPATEPPAGAPVVDAMELLLGM